MLALCISTLICLSVGTLAPHTYAWECIVCRSVCGNALCGHSLERCLCPNLRGISQKTKVIKFQQNKMTSPTEKSKVNATIVFIKSCS